MRVRESLDRLVDVFAIINSDRPFLKSLYRILRRAANRGIRIRLFDDRCFVRRKSGLISEIVECNHGTFEGHFAQILGANLIQRLVRFRDRILRGGLDRLRRLLPVGDRQHGVRFCSRNAKIIDGFQFTGGNI